jgi:E3 ubiquitin-protein ligase SHPRH
MSKLSKRASSQDFVQIPEISAKLPKGGLTSTRIAETLESLAAALDAQANTLDEWREVAIQSLLRPLVDEEVEEITGDEYEQSTKTQDEMIAYMTALRTLIADRHDALTGQENALVESEVRTTVQLEVDEDRPNSKIMELLRIRQLLKPSKDLGSLRGIVSELRAKSNSLKSDAENGFTRATNELVIVNTQLNNAQNHLSKQTKGTAALEKELDFFTSVMNTRLEYYRQLQRVSDMVGLYEGANDDTVLTKMLEDETNLTEKIATAKSKRRYLQHLHGEEQRICVVCSDEFDMGTLTVCGHQFCRECIKLWWGCEYFYPSMA